MRFARRLWKRPTAFDVAAILALALLIAELPLVAGLAHSEAEQPRPFTLVETGERFARLQDAVDTIGAGRGIVRIAPGTYHQCAVQQRGIVSYLAAAPGHVTFAGTLCEGKAALVLRGRAARVEGVVFTGMRVPEGNGAGIRLERGDLALSQDWFRDSENGILTANDPAHAITIDKSTFSRLGRCDRGLACAHSIYAGDYGSVTVTRSRFEAGAGGHYLKSRAARITVTDCAFDDGKGHATNYMIDLPAGATGRITGNWFLQGADKENHSAFIAVAAESHDHTANGLLVSGNVARFVPGLTWTSALVADWSGDRITVDGNRLGPGIQPYQKRW